jgi:hypothetical protein
VSEWQWSSPGWSVGSWPADASAYAFCNRL